MVHAFKSLGLNLLLDTGTMALHAVDDVAFLCARNFLKPVDEIAALTGHDEDIIRGAYDELQSLARAGQLFTPDIDASEYMRDEDVIKAMCLHAAHDCNLACKYCFAGDGSYSGGRALMPAEVGIGALDMLVKRSGSRVNLEVDFFGGEPLLNFNAIKEIVAYGRRLEEKAGKRFKFTLTTNAIKLDDDIMGFLNAEISNVVLSLDGRQEIHNAMRKTKTGKGSFDTALENSRKLADSRNHEGYYVRGTFTRDNMDFMRDVLFLREQGFNQISVEPVVLPGENTLSIREEDLPLIFNEYEALAGEYVRQRAGGSWFNFFHFMVDLGNGPCAGKRLSGCGAGTEYVAVTPDGDVYPCHQFVGKDNFCLGNIKDGSLDEGIRSMFRQNNAVNRQACDGCWNALFCGGGCAANAYGQNGSIDKPYKIGCEMQKKRTECALAIYATENMA